jgi:hypothetical protein
MAAMSAHTLHSVISFGIDPVGLYPTFAIRTIRAAGRSEIFEINVGIIFSFFSKKLTAAGLTGESHRGITAGLRFAFFDYFHGVPPFGYEKTALG